MQLCWQSSALVGSVDVTGGSGTVRLAEEFPLWHMLHPHGGAMPAPLAAELFQCKQTLSDWTPAARAHAASEQRHCLLHRGHCRVPWEGVQDPCLPASLHGGMLQTELPNYPFSWVLISCFPNAGGSWSSTSSCFAHSSVRECSASCVAPGAQQPQAGKVTGGYDSCLLDGVTFFFK